MKVTFGSNPDFHYFHSEREPDVFAFWSSRGISPAWCVVPSNCLSLSLPLSPTYSLALFHPLGSISFSSSNSTENGMSRVNHY